ncbi:methyl-CpG-binding domain-containing protein 2-like isoform X3 [Hibiscus syriacus]|uniref:methyl-CpG-binding domain-containing protein 2-like isoform X3 n=1 Tax=Hibiscus syriacus TaxID=106335 RepID=UPI00192444A7|nr:methyl-CpG-binding domain-containing protein 2-like isoform X3 [Hibiscus syriacus]
MQSTPEKAFVMLKREATDLVGSSFTSHMDNTFPDAASSASSSEDDDPQCRPSAGPRFSSSRLLPSVGAFTVQCDRCFKWRLIPTKEKYEEIREHILENPFVCVTAREWRPDISCDDPTDISQDGSRLWAIDKPNIAQPPPGWQRLLRIRATIKHQQERDCGQWWRYLIEHPEYATGVNLSRFSFQIPKPLQEDYVRKRPARQTASHGNEVNLLVWAGPDDTEVEQGHLALPPPTAEASVSYSPNRPAKQARRTPPEQMYLSKHVSKVEKASLSRNSNYDQ